MNLKSHLTVSFCSLLLLSACKKDPGKSISLPDEIKFEKVSSFDGGDVYNICLKDASNIFISAIPGICYSNDGGAHWSIQNKGYAHSDNRLICNSKGYLFTRSVSPTSEHTYRSYDKGQTWNEIFLRDETDKKDRIIGLEVGPDDKLYAGGSRGGIYVSSNNGDSWQLIEPTRRPNQSSLWASQILFNSKGNMYAYNPDFGKLAFSDDNLASFRLLNAGMDGYAIQKLFIDKYTDNLYAINKSRSEIYKSTDNAKTWVKFFSMNGRIIYSDKVLNTATGFGVNSKGYVYIYTRYNDPFDEFSANTWYNGVWRSKDGGSTWKHLTNGLPKYIASEYLADYAQNLAITNDDVIYLGTNWGVFKSTDDGETFSIMNSGIVNTAITSYNLSSEGVIHVGTNNTGIWKSTDDGFHWTQINNLLSNGAFVTANKNSLKVFTHINVASLSPALLSEDGGMTFTTTQSVHRFPNEEGQVFVFGKGVPSGVQLLVSFFIDKSYIPPSDNTYNLVFNSSNAVNSNYLASDAPITNWTDMKESSDGTVFMNIYSKIIYSTDKGNTWNTLVSASIGSKIIGMGIGKDKEIALLMYNDAGFSAARSTNMGKSWDDIAAVSVLGSKNFLIDNNGIYYIFNYYNNGTTIYRSADKGGTWQIAGTTPEYTQLNQEVIINKQGDYFICLSDGLYKILK